MIIELNKKTRIGIIMLCVMVVIFTSIYMIFLPSPVDGEKTITVQIISSPQNTKTIQINTNADYLRTALEDQALIQGEESAYGLYVSTVDGIAADESLQQWWCFTKDGEEIYTGVDTTPIRDGDNFEITLKTGY